MSNLTIETVKIKVPDGSTMNAYGVYQKQSHPNVGLMLFQEAFGVNEHIRDVANRLALEGFAVIAPELYHRTAPGFEGSYTDFTSAREHALALTEEGLSADIKATYEWFNSNESLIINHVSSIGFCLGGRVSLLANVTVPLLASVSYYGGGIAATMSDRLKDIGSPILMFWGGLDQHIGKDQIDTVTNGLTEHGKDFTNVIFSKADHGFFCDARDSYHPAAAKHAWALTLSFLRTNLPQRAGLS